MTSPPTVVGLPAIDEGQHRLDTGGQGVSEPVLLAHAITTILAAAVAAGWIFIPDHTLNTIADGLAFVISTVGMLAARAKVSPTGRITWDSVRSTIRLMLQAEIDRLVAAAPTLSPELAATAIADAITGLAQPAAVPPATSGSSTVILPQQPPVGP